jgi:hypothetical protein
MSGNRDPLEISLVHPRLIICEGEGDAAFFRHFIKERRLPEFDVHYPCKPLTETGGWSAYRDLLTALSLLRGWKGLNGILIAGDNDDDPSESFKRIQGQIEGLIGFKAPAEPMVVSRIAGLPSILVLMMPARGEKGALETLCLAASSEKNPKSRECIDRLVACLAADTWSAGKLLKLQMRCMLSSLCPKDPNTSLVHAWSKDRGDPIPLASKIFDPIAQVLQEFDSLIAGN